MEMVHFIPPSQRRLTLMAAQTDTAPVLIVGGAGSGKGALAKWIHQNSPRSGAAWVICDRPKALADEFRKAQGGTLVINEVGLLSLSEQTALLKILNQKSVVDENGMSQILNVRVIATTSQALEGRAQTHLFKPELLEKLNVFRIEMPALSKRDGEFDDIASALISEITRELKKDFIRGLSSEAMARLQSYDWPGNLRELRNVLRIAVISAQTEQVEVANLPDFGQGKVNFRATREEFEKTYILELLRTFNWDIDRTCEISHMDRSTLSEKIRKYGISAQSS